MMVALSHSLEVYTDGSVQVAQNTVFLIPPGSWRVSLHDIEQPPHYLARVNNCVDYPIFCKDGQPKMVDGQRRYKGMPEMIPAYSGNMNRLSKPWQWFCLRLLIWGRYGLFNESSPGVDIPKMVSDFNYLYGGGLAWCSGTGSATNANYIAGTHLDQPEIKMEALTCGGKLLKVIGRASHGGVGFLQCEALNTLSSPPDITKVNPATKPWLFTRSVVSRYDNTVIDFREYPMYVPFQDRGGVFEIKENRTRDLFIFDTFPPKATI